MADLISNIHMLDLNMGLFCYEKEMKGTNPDFRDGLLAMLIQQDARIKELVAKYEPLPKEDNTCPGCGREDC